MWLRIDSHLTVHTTQVSLTTSANTTYTQLMYPNRLFLLVGHGLLLFVIRHCTRIVLKL